MSAVAPEILVADITTLDVDAIVNAANEELQAGGGVCGAIHRAAGPGLAKACRPLAPCPTGMAVITPGFDLKARWVIHAVGPIYDDGGDDHEALLASCYRESFRLGHEHSLKSIAFPCISTGIYGYPLDEAADVALGVIGQWLKSRNAPSRVICCCFSEGDAAEYKRQLARRKE